MKTQIRRMTPADVADIQRCKAAGMTQDQAVKETGWSLSSVTRAWRPPAKPAASQSKKVALANKALAKANGHSAGVYRVVTATTSKEFKSKDEAMRVMTLSLARGVKARLFREIPVELRAVEKEES